MRNVSLALTNAAAIGIVLLAGCSGANEERLPTYPVSGQVFVNGLPAAGAVVQLYGKDDPKLEGLCPHAIVGVDGSFQLTTYKTGDGAPAGTYALTIKWPTPPLPGKDHDGPDRFGGRYSDPRKPVCQMEIVQGENDLGRTDLTVK
jgi:hypothetical protein